MKTIFNEAQLSRSQRESLAEIGKAFQAENKDEIEVISVEFPDKLMMKGDDSVGIILNWSDDSHYVGISEPEPEPSPSPEKRGVGAMMESPESTPVPDPIKLARLKYELMSQHLDMPVEKKIIFAKEYARLWSEHK